MSAAYANGAMPDDDYFGAEPTNDDGVARPKVWTPGDVVASWRAEGPLVHEPTGIATLDALTDGGPVYGSRWYLIGAPDAGKTALIAQLADTYARRGIASGIHAVDEEPGDVMTRLAQRAGWLRRDCEERDPDMLELIAEKLSSLPIRMYGGEHTIESAMADLHAYATERGMRAAYFGDSIQALRCDATEAVESLREAVSANVAALRTGATLYRMVAMATSEMNRNAYRNIDSADTTNDLAAGKESGAIEFSARVMLALRSVTGEGDLIAARIAKNKHGPSGGTVYMRIDRRHMILTEDNAPPVVDPEAKKAGHMKSRAADDAKALANLIGQNPGVGEKTLRSLVKSELGMGVQRLTDAKEMLLAGFGGLRLTNRGTQKEGFAWYLEPLKSGGES